MSLFTIGDLHLHFQSELKAPGQLHEPVWLKEVKTRYRAAQVKAAVNSICRNCI